MRRGTRGGPAPCTCPSVRRARPWKRRDRSRGSRILAADGEVTERSGRARETRTRIEGKTESEREGVGDGERGPRIGVEKRGGKGWKNLLFSPTRPRDPKRTNRRATAPKSRVDFLRFLHRENRTAAFALSSRRAPSPSSESRRNHPRIAPVLRRNERKERVSPASTYTVSRLDPSWKNEGGCFVRGRKNSSERGVENYFKNRGWRVDLDNEKKSKQKKKTKKENEEDDSFLHPELSVLK